MGTAFKLRQRMKNLSSCAHVLDKTLNLVISRCCWAAIFRTGNGKSENGEWGTGNGNGESLKWGIFKSGNL